VFNLLNKILFCNHFRNVMNMVRPFSELTKDFSAERCARIDERKKYHGLQIASCSGTVPLNYREILGSSGVLSSPAH
jgi:hypothetical protein